jgi:16S rRNA processing protein RimM
LIFLGKIVKVRGNKGEAVVASSPGFDLYSPGEGETLLVQSTRHQKKVIVEYCKVIHGSQVLKFKDINTINDALKLVGYRVYSQSVEAAQEESVLQFTVTDVQGNLWGIVTDLDSSSINLLLEVEDPEGDVIYVPFSDAIVKTINKDKKVIVIDPPEGLRDLNKKTKKLDGNE